MQLHLERRLCRHQSNNKHQHHNHKHLCHHPHHYHHHHRPHRHYHHHHSSNNQHQHQHQQQHLLSNQGLTTGATRIRARTRVRARSSAGARKISQTLVLALLGLQSILAIFLIDLAQACGPGRAGGRRHPNRYRKYSPLVQRQYYPNTGENTLGASGRPEGAIGRDDKRFKELVQNWNPDIEFRDDERTGADRMMSQRLKEKLSVLAISVMNQWPNVKLRVIEGWDEDYKHSMNSLHYEGRAVDITTSDRDKSKYGMLARLAVEAGFDWVHYESRSHVHCSVRSERADDVRNNGCFDAKSLVETPAGQMEMAQLQTNDLVLAMNSRGELKFSPVLMWLDRAEQNRETFVELQTKSGNTIRLTSSHLIYLADEPMPAPAPQPPPPPPSGPAAHSQRTNAAAAHDDLRANKTRAQEAGNNYYYYDTISGPAGRSTTAAAAAAAATSESDKTSLPPPLGGVDNNDGDADLSDYVYTTYARNALVGQYLLVAAPDEQLEFGSDRELGPAPGTGARGSGAGRIGRWWPEENPNELSAQGGRETHKLRRRGIRMRASQLARATSVKFDQIVGVNYTSRQGIYAPLTREGNIVVNSVVASCYAVISDHDLAHMSMAPVRWLSLVYEKIFGLWPETPAYERTVEYVQRREQYGTRVAGTASLSTSSLSPNDDSRNESREAPNHQTNNSLDRTKIARHIHWYPILLYNIARFVLPTAYLY